jgi:hypothetical protein
MSRPLSSFQLPLVRFYFALDSQLTQRFKYEPNNALEGIRLLVTPAAFAAVAPSNRLPQLGR